MPSGLLTGLAAAGFTAYHFVYYDENAAIDGQSNVGLTTLYIVQVQSRPYPRGGTILSSSDGSRSQIAIKASAVPLSAMFAATGRARPGNRFEVPVAQRRHRAIDEAGCDDLRVYDSATSGHRRLAWLYIGLASPHGSWPCPTMVGVLASSHTLSGGGSHCNSSRDELQWARGGLQAGSNRLGWRSGSLIRSPVLPPFVTCAASISPRLTRCNTV